MKPTQTIHHYKRNPSKSPATFAWSLITTPPKKRVSFNDSPGWLESFRLPSPGIPRPGHPRRWHQLCSWHQESMLANGLDLRPEKTGWIYTSWWFFHQTPLKNILVKMGIIPKYWWKWEIFELPPHSSIYSWNFEWRKKTSSHSVCVRVLFLGYISWLAFCWLGFL